MATAAGVFVFGVATVRALVGVAAVAIALLVHRPADWPRRVRCSGPVGQ
jgi:cytochrome c biogenesis protein CcdA